MSKLSKQIVSDFEMVLKKRSSSFGENGEPSYPFIAGYLFGMLQEFAENHPKVAKRLLNRIEMINESMGEFK